MSGEIYVVQGYAASWFESAQQAFDMAHELEAYAHDSEVANPEDVLKEAAEILEVALRLSSGQ